MLKVAAVIPPASINLGNDFFSLGGIEAFKETFSDVEMQIHLIEFFDSGERGFNEGRTSFFTEATLNWIKESADLVVLFGGCCLRPDMKPLFQPLIDTGTPFIGWGLSPTDYSQADVKFAKEIADQSLVLITRDDIIAKMVGDYPNFISGMDGGWWMGKSYNRPEKTTEYLVVNIESGNKLNVHESQRAVDILKEQTNSPIYMVSNNCERDYHHMHPQSLLITNSRHLYTTLANASYIESDAKTAGGLIIPDNAKEKPAEGEIVSVGEGARKDSGELIAMSVKAGDKVLFGKWSGTEVRIDGEELLIMKESDILGIL